MTNTYTSDYVKSMGIPSGLARSVLGDLAFRAMRKATALDSLELSIAKRAEVQLDPSERQRENQELLRNELEHLFYEMEIFKTCIDPESTFKIEDRAIPLNELDIPEFVLTKSNIREPEKVEVRRSYFNALDRTMAILEGVNPTFHKDFEKGLGGPENLILQTVNKAIEWLETGEPRKIEGNVSLDDIGLSQWQAQQQAKGLEEANSFILGWKAIVGDAENGNDLEFDGELEVARMASAS